MLGYCEVKTESKQAAREIYRTITSLSQHDSSRPDRKSVPPPRLVRRPDLPKPNNAGGYILSYSEKFSGIMDLKTFFHEMNLLNMYRIMDFFYNIMS